MDLEIYYRGFVIKEWVLLEKAIEAYISDYLSPRGDKQADIYELLIDRLSFENKRGVFKSIIDAEANKIIPTHNDRTKSNNKKLIEMLRLINLDRNRFAHYYSTPKQGLKSDEICLVEFRDGQKEYIYNEDKINRLIKDVRYCSSEIWKRVNELAKSN